MRSYIEAMSYVGLVVLESELKGVIYSPYDTFFATRDGGWMLHKKRLVD